MARTGATPKEPQPNRTLPSEQPARAQGHAELRTQQQRGPHTAASASGKQKQTIPPSKTPRPSSGAAASPSTTKDHAHAAPPEKLHGSNGGSESRISVTVSGWSTLSTNGRRLLHHQVVSGDDIHGQTHAIRRVDDLTLEHKSGAKGWC